MGSYAQMAHTALGLRPAPTSRVSEARELLKNRLVRLAGRASRISTTSTVLVRMARRVLASLTRCALREYSEMHISNASPDRVFGYASLLEEVKAPGPPVSFMEDTHMEIGMSHIHFSV